MYEVTTWSDRPYWSHEISPWVPDCLGDGGAPNGRGRHPPTRQAGWPETVLEGSDTLQFGCDRLPTGQFDDPDVVDHRYHALLWRVKQRSAARDPKVGQAESGRIRLARNQTDEVPAIPGPGVRIPVLGPLTLAGRYRYGPGEGLELVVSWYGRPQEASVTEERFGLRETDGGWVRVREDLTPPEDRVRRIIRRYNAGVIRDTSGGSGRDLAPTEVAVACRGVYSCVSPILAYEPRPRR